MLDTKEFKQQTLADAVCSTVPIAQNIAVNDVAVEVAEEMQIAVGPRGPT